MAALLSPALNRFDELLAKSTCSKQCAADEHSNIRESFLGKKLQSHDSNPGQRDKERERYFCAMPTPFPGSNLNSLNANYSSFSKRCFYADIRDTVKQDVAKLRSGVCFDGFSKQNETIFETKWTISNFFEKILINFDRFALRNWHRNFGNDRNFSKFISINFDQFRSRNDRKRSKFSRDRNEISKRSEEHTSELQSQR